MLWRAAFFVSAGGGGEMWQAVRCSAPGRRRALKPKNGFLDTPQHFVLGPRYVLGKRMRAAEETGGSWEEKGDALGQLHFSKRWQSTWECKAAQFAQK